MLRLTQIKLPLEHGPAQLRAAVLARLGIDPLEIRRRNFIAADDFLPPVAHFTSTPDEVANDVLPPVVS